MTFFLHPHLTEKIGLTETLARLDLETEYGRLAQKELRPYLPGEKDVLAEAWREMSVYWEAQQEHPGILKELREILHGIKNIQKSLRAARDGAILTDVDFYELKKQAFAMERIRRFLAQHRRLSVPSVQMEEVQWLTRLLDPEDTKIETFYLYDAYDPELKDIRLEKRALEEGLIRKRKQAEQQALIATGLQPLWNGEILVPRDAPSLREKLEKTGLYEYSGETVREWIYRQHSHEQQDELEKLLVQEEKVESRVRQRLSRDVGIRAEQVLKNTRALGHLDLLISKVFLAVRHRAVQPQFSPENEIKIVGGRHPVLEETLKKRRQKLVPIDLTLHRGTTVITGANMGGKTMTLKMTALLVAMAQMGFWVPADTLEFTPVKWIYFSSGDEQSQALGLSTFGAEIHGLGKVLNKIDEPGLILLDELASGTNPREGASISKAIVEYLAGGLAVSLITTHYDGVGELPGVKHLQVVGLRYELLQSMKDRIQVQEWSPGMFEEAMDYRLQPKEPGAPVPKDAIAVAEMMGLKREIIMKDRMIMSSEGSADGE